MLSVAHGLSKGTDVPTKCASVRNKVGRGSSDGTKIQNEVSRVDTKMNFTISKSSVLGPHLSSVAGNGRGSARHGYCGRESLNASKTQLPRLSYVPARQPLIREGDNGLSFCTEQEETHTLKLGSLLARDTHGRI